MNLDAIIHPTKNFAELDDADIEAFLRERTFKSEHLNLEFKNAFPERGSRYDIREICKYIVGLSNEEGGLVVYGVSDSIKDPAAQFPAYVPGLGRQPSLEDLSQWVKERIHPLIASPSIRFFSVQGRTVAVVKVPAGANKPYCYYDPGSKVICYFKKTAGTIVELTPDEVREFHRTHIIEQANKILRASELREGTRATGSDIGQRQLEAHQRMIKAKLENAEEFGFLGIYSLPAQPVDIPAQQLINFLTEHRYDFSAEMRYYPQVEPLQRGVSVGYFPRSIRPDIKSTWRTTLYQDGLIALDSQADSHMDKDKTLQPFWLAYELQRHLQLSRALLEGSGVDSIHVTVELDNIEDFSMIYRSDSSFGAATSPYSGSHQPIERDVNLSEVYAYDSANRNIVLPSVKDIMDEISRIFGFSKTVPGVWDTEGRLGYVPQGLEHQR
jgi:hypothetical protein